MKMNQNHCICPLMQMQIQIQIHWHQMILVAWRWMEMDYGGWDGWFHGGCCLRRIYGRSSLSIRFRWIELEQFNLVRMNLKFSTGRLKRKSLLCLYWYWYWCGHRGTRAVVQIYKYRSCWINQFFVPLSFAVEFRLDQRVFWNSKILEQTFHKICTKKKRIC